MSFDQKAIRLKQLMARVHRELRFKKWINSESLSTEELGAFESTFYKMTLKNEIDFAQFETQARRLADFLE